MNNKIIYSALFFSFICNSSFASFYKQPSFSEEILQSFSVKDEPPLTEEQSDVKKITEFAKQGDAQAQFTIGTYYLGIQKYSYAAFWFQKASEQNHPESQFFLAQLYYSGKGVPVDTNKSISLFKKSSDNGVIEASNALSLFYLSKEHYNIKEAYKWVIKAAEANNANALYNLAIFYSEGLVVPASQEKFNEYMEKSAQQGLITAQNQMRVLSLNDKIELYKWNIIILENNSFQKYESQDKIDEIKSRAQKSNTVLENTLSELELNQAKKNAQDWLEKYPSSLIKN